MSIVRVALPDSVSRPKNHLAGLQMEPTSPQRLKAVGDAFLCKPWKEGGHNRNRKRDSSHVRGADRRLRVRAEELSASWRPTISNES